ncbi:DNA cytosine methyltransferase [Mycolicibacterium goodii]|uniref:DNA cytosine methyltransferase n=1 Tax=Mycolicibacterium goodii TaxID=134601 RepID=UPI001BDCF629|nr:DNA cytosine methyltransferase [Mycolicibacterium goodii]MBU8834166.1 DNA cytosine methyltransferase [Mycolicibacterium goodii]
MLTLTDLFCGAGGSSTGAIEIPGVEVRVASNHWDLAVETHNTNHPDADHVCADLSQIDPRRFPRTDILWASPECTNHSVAKGRKRADSQPDLFGEVLPDAAAERSRATMWDVPRFAEAHRYQAVIVENVVDAWHWQPFQAWLMAMDSLGYEHHIVFLNSMHAQAFGPGAPQSRDRMYVVFWRKGNQRPDVDRLTRPEAVCPTCGQVRVMQSWKRPERAPWGRYRAQYVYRCPSTTCRNQVLEPLFRPAAEIIDWSLLGQRIGDRDKPLAEKTMARIRAGIERYWLPLLVPVEGRDGKAAAPVDQPTRTMTTRNETGLLVPTGGTWRTDATSTDDPIPTRTTRENDGIALAPFIAELRGGGSKHRPVDQPLATVTASGTHHGLVTTYYGNGGVVPTREALPTCTTVERHALLMRHHTARGDQGQMSTPVTEPARTMMANGPTPALLHGRPTIDVEDVLFRMLEPREIARAMDFPAEYRILGNRREQVRQAGNAVTPPAARDLVGVVAESLGALS